MSQIVLRNVSLSRNNAVILQNIDLIIPEGEWTSIVGPNGAGKSTLVQALAGLLSYEGSIRIGGVELHSIAIKTRAQQIAWLEQATATPDSLDFGLQGKRNFMQNGDAGFVLTRQCALPLQPIGLMWWI